MKLTAHLDDKTIYEQFLSGTLVETFGGRQQLSAFLFNLYKKKYLYYSALQKIIEFIDEFNDFL